MGINNYFKILIDNIKTPDHWLKEGTEKPNKSCKLTAIGICKAMYCINRILPDRIAASKESGIFLVFRIKENKEVLYIEVYNTLDISYLKEPEP